MIMTCFLANQQQLSGCQMSLTAAHLYSCQSSELERHREDSGKIAALGGAVLLQVFLTMTPEEVLLSLQTLSSRQQLTYPSTLHMAAQVKLLP